MNKYIVNLSFEDTYEIDADSEAEAVSEAINMAVMVGEWEHDAMMVEVNVDEC